MNWLFIIILYFILFTIFIIIFRKFFNKKNEIHSCKECDFLNKKYCQYMEKRIKDINKLNCIKEDNIKI